MKRDQARNLVKETLTQKFDKGRFTALVGNLLNRIDAQKAFSCNSHYVKDAFKPHVARYERIATYTAPDQRKIDILVVHLTEKANLARTRTALRNFVADYLKNRDRKDAALVAFVSPSEPAWRFSYVKMEYATVETLSGDIATEARLTPARRFSYLVGPGESCHTAQARFVSLLQDTTNNPTLADIEAAFSVEAVTKEFFARYKELFLAVKDELDAIAAAHTVIEGEFSQRKLSTADFAKKLMGQIVFLYFLQKKGWLGVPKGSAWGKGPHNFLRKVATGEFGKYGNLFNDLLEPLFYDTLATDRGHEALCKQFNCRIPFLNGGLFEPPGGYDWRKTEILLPNRLFTNSEPVEEGVIGTGILDVFDRYNFTVNEAEPLEKEVAIDPEMLGKVFENLLEVKERKSKGSFYTPREIVHYMCQESLINYLDTAVNSGNGDTGIGGIGATGIPACAQSTPQGGTGIPACAPPKAPNQVKETQTGMSVPPLPQTGMSVPRSDIEALIHLGEQAADFEAARIDGTVSYSAKLPKTIQAHARLLDEKLAAITVCDPAIGSGAFPVGMMQEIVRLRSALTPYFNDIRDRTAYHFKRHAIQNCLYGVDIDPGAVEIAKLRLWLSLVVDEEETTQIKPLPNLDYKVVVGNSLLGVEKTLFNEKLFTRLEELKPKYFDETDSDKKQECRKEIDQIIHELTNGQTAFDFEIYFSEVFHHAKKGFDVVIGNPPYLEARSPAFGEGLKDALKRSLIQRWPGLDATGFIPRGSDLLVYFMETGVRLAAQTGVVALITQNAWLDTEYGVKFQRFLVDRTHVALVVDSNFRHFDTADGPDINTVITFFRGRSSPPTGYTIFARFERPLALGAISSSGRAAGAPAGGVPFRQYPTSSPVLRSTKWGILLSLDEVVLQLLATLESRALCLPASGPSRLWVGQGLNLTKDYYVNTSEAMDARRGPEATIPIFTSADGAQFVVKDTAMRLAYGPAISSPTAESATPKGARLLDTKLVSRRRPVLILPRGIGRHFCALNPARAFSSSFVEIYSASEPSDAVLYSLWAVLNSSALWLLREATGRKNLGGGMLKAEAVDLRDLPFLVRLPRLREIEALADRLRGREALDTISEIETPEHQMIDDLVFGHLGIPNATRELVVDALKRKVLARDRKSQIGPAGRREEKRRV